MLLLRSFIFSLGMIGATLVIAPLAMLTFPLPYGARYRFISQWARFVMWWLEKTCGVRYQVKGRENLPAGAAIVLSKHQSTWETLAFQQIFPPQVWVLKRELLFVPLFGWGLALLEPIAINRKSRKKAMAQVLDQGQDRLHKGRWVIIFPEGTRMPPGVRGKYRMGGARLAAHTGFPVVPVAHNAGEYWGRKKFIKRPGTVTVSIGPVIESEGRDPTEIHQQAEAWIEGEMTRISGVAQRNAAGRQVEEGA